MVITRCHFTRHLSSPTGRDCDSLHFTEEETEVPRGELESPDHTESRWRSQDANSVCLRPRSEPPPRSCLLTHCPSSTGFQMGEWQCLDHVTIIFMTYVCYLSLPLGQLYDGRDFALFTVISQKLELCLAQSRYHMTLLNKLMNKMKEALR